MASQRKKHTMYTRAADSFKLAPRSGIAALLLEGGRTAHSRFRLPVPLPLDGATCHVKPGSVAANLLRDARLIVWDEAPTAPKAALVAVDQLLRDLMGRPDLPFGGKPVVLGGDFRQIPPILRRVDERAVKSFTLRAMPWWAGQHVARFALTRNMRAREDPSYARFLGEVGDGTLPHSACDVRGKLLHPRAIRLPDDVAAPLSWKPCDLLAWVYGGYESVAPADWSRFYEKRAVVTPTNAAASELNDTMMQGLPEDGGCMSRSSDYIVADEGEVDHYTPEFLNSLEPSGMPPHELKVKEGALMMVLRNYAPRKGLCNGTRVVVRGRWRRLLQVQIVTGPFRGNLELLPRIVCDSSGDGELPFTLRRVQFPLRPAWAMTINKSQGQTVGDRLGIYLPTPVFSHGQLYVAASRAERAACVRVLVENYEDQQRKMPRGGGHPDAAAVYTLNLVDRTLLCDDDEPQLRNAGYPVLAPPTAAAVAGSSAATAPDLDEQAEQLRLATVLPDPGASKPGSNAGLSLNPSAADEWAPLEAGAPSSSNGSAPAPLLESRAAGQIDYVSDDEAEDFAESVHPYQDKREALGSGQLCGPRTRTLAEALSAGAAAQRAATQYRA